MQGFRLTMEDHHTLRTSLSKTHPDLAFFGIYDGRLCLLPTALSHILMPWRGWQGTRARSARCFLRKDWRTALERSKTLLTPNI